VLGFVVGAAQSELAGPLARGRSTDAEDAAARIGAVAGEQHSHIEALSKVAMKTSIEDDFDGGLRVLLDGVALRSHCARPDASRACMKCGEMRRVVRQTRTLAQES
jgi:hypothetical protein